MLSLEDIYNDIKLFNIELFQHPVGKHRSAVIERNGEYAIFNDAFTYEKISCLKCDLMHELGHCLTGTTHKLCSPFQLIQQHEYRANKYAAFRYIPPKKVQGALDSGVTEMWQLAEWFDLPQSFVEKAFVYYRDNGYLEDSCSTEETG